MPTDGDFDSPDNVHQVRMSLDAFQERCQQHFDFPLALGSAYKITDLRPAFGEIFADELRGSDFWGHSDWDVIFGDLRHTFTDDVLDTFDKLLVRGSLALYRNIGRMNSLYRTEVPGANYREVFSSPRLDLHFDEWGGIWKILQATSTPVWNEPVVFDVNPFKIRPRANDTTYLNPVYRWERGAVFESEGVSGQVTQGAGIHLQKRRMRTPPMEVLESELYWIAADRFQLQPPANHTSPLTVATFLNGRVRRRLRALRSRKAPPAA